jgi:hypothetical protein
MLSWFILQGLSEQKTCWPDKMLIMDKNKDMC